MLSSVEAWWAGLCARPFDGAQGDTPFLGHYLFAMSIDGLLLLGEGWVGLIASYSNYVLDRFGPCSFIPKSLIPLIMLLPLSHPPQPDQAG